MIKGGFLGYSNCVLKLPEQGENPGEDKVIPLTYKKDTPKYFKDFRFSFTRIFINLVSPRKSGISFVT